MHRLEKSVLQAACKMCGSVGMLQVPRPESALTHTKFCLVTLTSICCVGSGSDVKVVAFGARHSFKNIMDRALTPP